MLSKSRERYGWAYCYNCKRIKGNGDNMINCQSEMSVYLSCCADKQNIN